MLHKSIQIKTEFQGFHRWKDAVEEVAFLRNWHRHIFKVDVSIDVNHGNRELEYFMVLKRLNEYLALEFKDKYFEFSCEDIAESIINNFLIKTYGDERAYAVRVSEDGENSAIISYLKDNK